MHRDRVLASILSSLMLLLSECMCCSSTLSKSSLSSCSAEPNELLKMRVNISPMISTPILVSASLRESEFCLTELLLMNCYDSVLTTWKMILMPM